MPSVIVPVIIAGGIGERFWPLSRAARPKQLLAIFSQATMIEETFDRTRSLASKGARPLLVTGTRMALQIKKLMAGKRGYDCIAEPVGKNTAPAIVLAAAWIEAAYGESIMAVMPADHCVRPLAAFNAAIRYACAIAESENRLVVFGVQPTRPETGYGYIELGKKISGRDGVSAHEVVRFVEKPDAATAAKYCGSARYRWNSGIFVWKTGVILEEAKKHLPALHAQAFRAARKKFSAAAIAAFYQAAEKESIDYGIMERSRRVAAVVGQFEWDDVGSWEAVPRLCGTGPAGTSILGNDVYEKECRDTILVNKSGGALAAIGCSGLAVVATGDAVLVISRSRLPELKKYLGEMKSGGKFPAELF